MIDLKYAIEISGGDNDFIIQILDKFVTHSPEYREDLAHALRLKDKKIIFHTAHKYKSACGVVGAMNLVKTLTEIENQSLDKNSNGDLDSLLSKAISEAEVVEQEVKAKHATLTNA